MTTDHDISSSASCYYERLGLQPEADPEDIEGQWQLALSTHHYDSGGTEASFTRLQEAYDTLSDPRDRRAYDSLRAEFGSERASALYDEWVADGRSGDPVSYYRHGEGDINKATRRADRDTTPPTNGSDADNPDDGSQQESDQTGDPEEKRDEEGCDDDDYSKAATDAARWRPDVNIIETTVNSGFPIWVLQVLSAAVIATAGQHVVTSGSQGELAEFGWLLCGLLVSFGAPFAMQQRTHRGSAKGSQAARSVVRLVGLGLLGMTVAGVAAVTAGLPFMGIGFVGFVIATVVIVGVVLTPLGVIAGQPVGGFALGCLAAVAAMAVISPFNPDSFQALLYTSGIYPYPFVPPYRLGIFNIGFLCNLIILVGGSVAVLLACWRTTTGILAPLSEPNEDDTVYTGRVCTVVPAIPVALAVEHVLSGESALAPIQRLANTFGTEVTTPELTILMVLGTFVAWGAQIEALVRSRDS